jgi:hypothetical protein
MIRLIGPWSGVSSFGPHCAKAGNDGSAFHQGIFRARVPEKRPRPVLSSRGPGPDVGALGDIEGTRDCPGKTPMLLGLDQVARGVCAKLNTPCRSARNEARSSDAYCLSLGQRVQKSCRCRVAAGCDVSRGISRGPLRRRHLSRVTHARRPDA